MSDAADVVVSIPGGRAQIHLAGFMGSGKSTVGRLLARQLLWNFLDLDGVVERHEGRSVTRIFSESGEAALGAPDSQPLAVRRYLVRCGTP